MTGPGDEMSTAGRGRPRASDADREQVIGTLKAAFVQGLLTKDELDARVGQAFASWTDAELAAVTTGIPAGGPGPAAAGARPGAGPAAGERGSRFLAEQGSQCVRRCGGCGTRAVSRFLRFPRR